MIYENIARPELQEEIGQVKVVRPAIFNVAICSHVDAMAFLLYFSMYH